MAKRFYKDVAVAAQGGGYVVTLDGRVLKTPGKQDLSIDSKVRAKLVAAEWQAQGDDIKPETMPCTRLMNVARELTPSRRPELIKEFSSYCETDLLCFAPKPRKIWQSAKRKYGSQFWIGRHASTAFLYLS